MGRENIVLGTSHCVGGDVRETKFDAGRTYANEKKNNWHTFRVGKLGEYNIIIQLFLSFRPKGR